LLLKKFDQSELTCTEALRVIRIARTRARKVDKLLRALGNSDEDEALADRFRRLSKSVQPGTLDAESAELYRRLTLAFHNLTVIISDAFYRSPT
jgi:hypothetical protein